MAGDNVRLMVAQTNSADDHATNVAALRQIAARASATGAELLALPEAAGLMQKDPDKARAFVTDEAEDPYIAAARELAAEYGLWVQLGSTPVLAEGGRFRNHGLMIDAAGGIVARYDKIHLFDVFLEGRAPTGESERYVPGDEGMVTATPWGPMGLSICYDLRFPHLFRDYAKAGARVIFVPSAFTVPTGRAHWEVLLRARAIETGAWIVAAAQVGRHADGRTTWGHSLVVTPWGEVRTDLGGNGPAEASVDLDLTMVEAARRQIPALAHDRPYEVTVQKGS